MHQTRRLLPLLFALATAATQPAFAGLSARLVYLRSGSAESCPDQAALKKAVARRLGYDPFFVAAPYTIVAEVSGNGTELRARARLLDDSGIVLGSRELLGKSADCAELLASLALAISLTLDPMVVATEPEPSSDLAAASGPSNDVDTSSAPIPTTEPPAEAPPPARVHQRQPATPATPKPSERGLSLRLDGGLLAAFGWVPKSSPAVAIGFDVRHRNLSLGLEGVTTTPQARTNSNGLSATVSLAYAALAPCVWFGPLSTCAVGSLGRYSADGGGVDAVLTENSIRRKSCSLTNAATDADLRRPIYSSGMIWVESPTVLMTNLATVAPSSAERFAILRASVGRCSLDDSPMNSERTTEGASTGQVVLDQDWSRDYQDDRTKAIST